ncbi:MAG: hypothetical protein WKF94_00235 [Solirubrobacteraceae bacterium]
MSARRPSPVAGGDEERYAHLQAHGPTPHAFGFQRHFLPPDADTEDAITGDGDLCPA